MPDRYNILIIGQGLAGSILAYRLIQSGHSVLVIDNQHHGSSSKVAAGLINPITGYRLSTNQHFRSHQSTAFDFYSELEALLGKTLLVHLDQYRLLKSDEQIRYWRKVCKHPKHRIYTGQHFKSHPMFNTNEYGVVEIKHSARVYTDRLLMEMKQYFIAKGAYLNGKVDYATLRLTDTEIQFNGVTSDILICCEGYQAIHNPWWQHLPFKLSKGEILSVELDQNLPALLNWRQWLVPETGSSSMHALLGANYEWGDFTQKDALNTTQTAREYLLQRLRSNTAFNVSVKQQQAGIRPTPTHHKPYIGPHKTQRNIYCFNGFGSKGSVTIPYYSQLLCEHLTRQIPLPDELTQWL